MGRAVIQDIVPATIPSRFFSGQISHNTLEDIE